MPFNDRAEEILGSSLPRSNERLASLGKALFAKIEELASAIERSTVWPLTIFLAAYLPLTVLIARHKLLWDDEFFTLYLSRPSMSGILKALKDGR